VAQSTILVKKKMIQLEPTLLVECGHQTLENEYYRYYIYLGSIQIRKGKQLEARKNFQQYVQLNPSNPLVYLLLFVTFMPSKLVFKLFTLRDLFTAEHMAGIVS